MQFKTDTVSCNNFPRCSFVIDARTRKIRNHTNERTLLKGNVFNLLQR